MTYERTIAAPPIAAAARRWFPATPRRHGRGYILCLAVSVLLLGTTAAFAADGKTVFLGQKCNLCHSVPSAGIEAMTKSEKMKGPDLPGSSSVAELKDYLRQTAQREGKKHPKKFTGSDEELQALLDWLGEQK